MKEKAIFTSSISLADAQMKARMAGYSIIGQSSNPGKHIVFARPLNAIRMV